MDTKRILLVDDDEDLASTLKLILEDHNYRVTLAENGVNALKQVMQHDFDVVICDMMMPKMPGDMFYLAVQKTKPALCNRFIFITGHSGNEKVDAFLRKVSGLMLVKPVTIKDLVKGIRMVVERSAEGLWA